MVAPCTCGRTSVPSFDGTMPGTRIGRPFLSKPLIQFVFDVGLAEQELAGHAVEHVHEAVAIGPEHRLGRRAAPIDVGEHGHLRRVVVHLVVRRELVVPLQLARVGVEREHAVAVEVVAEPVAAVPVGRRIAGAEEHEVRLGIVGARVPDGGAAFLPRVARPRVVAGLAGPGNRVDAPHFLAGRRVERRDDPADAEVAARGADDDLVLHDDRRHRDRVALRRAPRPSCSRAACRSSRRSRAGARRSCP